jgi:hypothetical protein
VIPGGPSIFPKGARRSSGPPVKRPAACQSAKRPAACQSAKRPAACRPARPVVSMVLSTNIHTICIQRCLRTLVRRQQFALLSMRLWGMRHAQSPVRTRTGPEFVYEPSVRLGRSSGSAGRQARPVVRLGRSSGSAGRQARPVVRFGRSSGSADLISAGPCSATRASALPQNRLGGSGYSRAFFEPYGPLDGLA